MTAVACNNLAGQLALSYSQPILKPVFYSDIYTVQEEIDTNSNHIRPTSKSIVKHKTQSLQRGVVRFAQEEVPADLSATKDLSNSKDSGLGSSDDNGGQADSSSTIPASEVEDEVEEDEEFAQFTQTARKFTDVDVQKLSSQQRRDRMTNCLGWLREEIMKMKKQDQTLMRQFMELRSTIHQLKRNTAQESLRTTYLRNQMSCANLGVDQSARSNLSSCSRSTAQLNETSQPPPGNLMSQQFTSRGNLSQMQAASRTNLSSPKVSNSLMHLEDGNFDVDTYFADFDEESDSFIEDDDSTFLDQPMAVGGGRVSALAEVGYMPQYRSRTVSLVTNEYIGRPTATGYLARSRYMSFSTAKGQIESERAILE